MDPILNSAKVNKANFIGGGDARYVNFNAPKKATGQYVNTYRAKFPAGSTVASVQSAISRLQAEMSKVQSEKIKGSSTAAMAIKGVISGGLANIDTRQKLRDKEAKIQAIAALISEYQETMAGIQYDEQAKADAKVQEAADKKAALEQARQDKIDALKADIAAQQQVNQLAQTSADTAGTGGDYSGYTPGNTTAGFMSGGTGKMLIYGGIAVAGLIMIVSLMRRGNHPAPVAAK